MGAVQSFYLDSTVTKYNPETLTWSGPAIPALYHPNVSMGQVIVTALSRNPNHVGQISHEDGYEMQNWEILRDAIRVSLNLRDLRLKEGDVVGIPAGNSRYLAAVTFGALLNGLPISPVEPNGSVDDISHMYGITQPKIVICDDYNYERVSSAFRRLNNPAPIYVFDQEEEDNPTDSSKWQSVKGLLREHPEENDYQFIELSDGETLPAFIMCSSGTTGPPKAIPISHAAFAYMAQAFSASGTVGVRTFCMSSLYWMTGVCMLLNITLLYGTRIIVRKVFSPAVFLDVIKTRKVNMLLCAPAHIQLFLLESYEEEDLSSLRVIFCGGSAVPDGLSELIKRPVLSGYGITEGGSIANGGRPGTVTGGSNVGQLAMGINIKIIDDEGNRLGIGEKGEICIATRHPFLGYYRNEAATKDVLKDGWLHSGDLGFFDEKGNLHIVDRKKEIFKYNNFHINPSDIENVIGKLDGVNLVSVVAIPDKIYSSLPAAVVKRTPGSEITAEDIHKYVKGNLTGFKWLRGGIYFVDQMPLTPSGKIIRRLTTQLAIRSYEENKDIGFTY